ncbi:MAG: hypothetical protein OQK78_00695 [Gammaproteobacteria bacterium]|nr:hypothetical protein [Gammaproteobacteria bacterium]MCW8983619.1 hypothetical protein [Gammaproteobacteria bacterium]
MISRQKLVVAVGMTFLVGCSATPYQPMGFTGGYKDAHIRDNLYFVEVSTNAYTSQSTAAQYMHRRAKEVCIENGYKDYKIQGERDTSTQFATGSYGSGSVTASSMNKPGFSGYVRCIK